MNKNPKLYSTGEEIANAITHGLGALLGIVALVLMIMRGSQMNNSLILVTGIVYGTSIILLYTASTLYHSMTNPKAKSILQKADHSAIYVLIAGTYTPFALLTLRGAWGWSIFGAVWSLALAGILFELVWPNRWPRLSLMFYLGMGWMALVAAKPMAAHLSPTGLGWLLAGGLLYSGGAVFYRMRNLTWHHAIWHVFVLAGSMAHFYCVYNFVMK